MPTIAAAATLAMLLAMTLSTTVAVRTFMQGKSEDRFRTFVENTTGTVGAEVDRNLAELFAIEGLFKSSERVSVPEFNAFAASLERRGARVKALGYVRRVHGFEAAAFNRLVEGYGKSGYDVRRLKPSPPYLAVEHVFPPGEGVLSPGMEVTRDPVAGGALARAAEVGGPAATAPILNAAAPGEAEFLVFTPVYTGQTLPDDASEEARPAPEGFAFARYRVRDFLAGPLLPEDTGEVKFRIVDREPRGRAIEIYPAPGGDSTRSWPEGYRATAPLEPVGRLWEFQFAAPLGYGLSPLEDRVWVIVLSAGMAITFVAAGSTYSLLASRRAVRSDLDIMNTQLSVILDSALEGIVLVGADRRVVWANQRFAEDFGFGDADTLQGLELADLLDEIGVALADEHGFLRRVESVMDDLVMTVANEDVALTSPSERILSMTSVPVADRCGTYLGRLWVFRDVTQERAADRAKSVFVSMVSHELRTPLTSVIGYLDLAADSSANGVTPKATRFLERARVNAGRLRRLVSDILETSRLESGGLKLDLGPVALDDLMSELLDSMRERFERHGLGVSVSIPARLPSMWADRERMAQILTNLLTNAIRYTPDGGRIEIRARAKGASVEISVADTGIGIPASAQPRIFEKFVRVESDRPRPSGSTGLGLAITKSLVELQGGSISVESKEGIGSTFIVSIPAALGESG